MTSSARRNTRASGLVALFALLTIACGVCANPITQRPGPAPVPATGGVEIGQVATARSVGTGNRPQDVTDTFSTGDPIIYVVAEVQRVSRGTSLFARWSRNGQPFEDTPTITADRDYTNTWLEFHIQSERGAFEPGDYSVTIFADGNPVASQEFAVR